MEIIEGKVSNYKGHSDIHRFYGKIGEEIKYYFLDFSPFANGNMIATTELVEAIDPEVAASHIGVVDKDGNVIIPLENRMIKPITPEIILVEKAIPISQNVIDAIALSKDSKGAVRLVSLTNDCKNRVMGKIGSGSALVFHNQLSEASIFDINGKNLVNDEFYSYIGVSEDKIYLGKNVVDVPVFEYSMIKEDVEKEKEPIVDNSVNEEPINVEETAAQSDEIKENVDNVMEEAENNIDNSVNVVNENAEVPVEQPESVPEQLDVPEQPEVPVEQPESTPEQVDVPEQPEVPVEQPESTPEQVDVPEQPEVPVDQPEPVQEQTESPEENNVDESALTDIFNDNDNVSDEDDEAVDVFNDNVLDNNEDNLIDEVEKQNNEEEFNLEDNSNIFSDIPVDKIERGVSNDYSRTYNDDYNYNSYSSSYGTDDVFSSAGKVMGSLISLNRKQKSDINRLNLDLDKANNNNRMKSEQIENLESRLDSASNKVRDLDSMVTKLESQTTILSSKVDDQKRLIESQNREISNKDREIEDLRRQLQGKEELARFIQDAQSLLGSNDY